MNEATETSCPPQSRPGRALLPERYPCQMKIAISDIGSMGSVFFSRDEADFPAFAFGVRVSGFGEVSDAIFLGDFPFPGGDQRKGVFDVMDGGVAQRVFQTLVLRGGVADDAAQQPAHHHEDFVFFVQGCFGHFSSGSTACQKSFEDVHVDPSK